MPGTLADCANDAKSLSISGKAARRRDTRSAGAWVCVAAPLATKRLKHIERRTCLKVMTGGYNSRRRIPTMALSRRDFLASSAVALGAGMLGRPALARGWQQQTP